MTRHRIERSHPRHGDGRQVRNPLAHGGDQVEAAETLQEDVDNGGIKAAANAFSPAFALSASVTSKRLRHSTMQIIARTFCWSSTPKIRGIAHSKLRLASETCNEMFALERLVGASSGRSVKARLPGTSLRFGRGKI
jgi:hypothetical protein